MVEIEQNVWGMIPEGEAIILYTCLLYTSDAADE